MTSKLLIFTRYPIAGKAKTRLIPALGAKQAAKLQQQMTERITQTAQDFCSQHQVHLEVAFAGGNRELFQQWLGDNLHYVPQASGDLGQKMHEAFVRSFEEGHNKVVIEGSDCPSIDSQILQQAFDELQDHDLVLGPAHDGGYYLIGLRASQPALFEEISWGGEKVLEDTLAKAKQEGLAYSLLPPLNDIDRPEDLVIWEKIQRDSFMK